MTFAVMNVKINRETELRNMGFTEKTLGFISENYMRNDREWFKEHKGDYEALVLAPFAELLETLAPVMEKIDDKLICTPKCVSRIYRDARAVVLGAPKESQRLRPFARVLLLHFAGGLWLRVRILPHGDGFDGTAEEDGAFGGQGVHGGKEGV